MNSSPKTYDMSSGTSTKGPKTSKWDENAHKALICPLLNVLEANAISIHKDTNSSVLMAYMGDHGHQFTFEGLR